MATLGRYTNFPGIDRGSTRIGSFCSIAEMVYFHGPDNHACKYRRNLVATFDWGTFGSSMSPSGLGESTVVGNDVWIGTGAKILCGLTIGDGAMIGAHAVVAKNVPPYAVVVGNPAKIVHYRFSEEIIKKLLDIKWWDWDEKKIVDNIEDFSDIERFVEKHWKKI